MTPKEFQELLIRKQWDDELKKEFERALDEVVRENRKRIRKLFWTYDRVISRYKLPTYTPNLFPATL